MLRRTTAYTRYQIYFQDIVNPLYSSNMVPHKPPYILHCYTRLIHVLYVLLSSIDGLTRMVEVAAGEAKNTAIQISWINQERTSSTQQCFIACPWRQTRPGLDRMGCWSFDRGASLLYLLMFLRYGP